MQIPEEGNREGRKESEKKKGASRKRGRES